MDEPVNFALFIAKLGLLIVNSVYGIILNIQIWNFAGHIEKQNKEASGA
jgi:hypothetical protein